MGWGCGTGGGGGGGGGARPQTELSRGYYVFYSCYFYSIKLTGLGPTHSSLIVFLLFIIINKFLLVKILKSITTHSKARVPTTKLVLSLILLCYN